MTSELHPLEPFLPVGARLLMLGSFTIRKNKEVNEFLCQDTEEKFAFDEEVELLKKVFDD